MEKVGAGTGSIYFLFSQNQEKAIDQKDKKAKSTCHDQNTIRKRKIVNHITFSQHLNKNKTKSDARQIHHDNMTVLFNRIHTQTQSNPTTRAQYCWHVADWVTAPSPSHAKAQEVRWH